MVLSEAFHVNGQVRPSAQGQYMLGSFLVYGVWHSYSFCFTCMEYQCMSLGSLYQAYIEFI